MERQTNSSAVTLSEAKGPKLKFSFDPRSSLASQLLPERI